MRRFFKRIASLFGARHAENELRREIESHVRILQDDFEKTGLSPAEAKLAARRSYGNVEFVKELHRETRSYLWIENLLKDTSTGGEVCYIHPDSRLLRRLLLLWELALIPPFSG